METMRIRHLGLRAQIVLSLAALLAVVFSFTAIAVLWVLRASVEVQRQSYGQVAGEAVTRLVAHRMRDEPRQREIDQLLASSVGQVGISSIGVFDATGRPLAQKGIDADEVPLQGLDPRRPRSFSHTRHVQGDRGRELVIMEPVGPGQGSVVAVVDLSTDGSELSRFSRPILIYLFVSGLMLLAFGYVALTRLIVRPLEKLTTATEKVSQGTYNIRVPVSGGYEIAQAARAFNAMTRTLRSQQGHLTQKIDELEQTTTELRSTQDQLVRSAKLASVGSLAAGVAHEVGNPVSAIMGLSEVILDGGIDEDERTEYMERIAREAERVHRIVGDLLEYARPAPSDMEGPSVVGEAVDSAVGLLSPQKAYKAVDIQVVGDADLPPVQMGLDPLTQVLVNLMMNAADAVDGQGQVRVRLAKPKEGAPKEVRISISDSGAGVPESELERIFEPFFTTKDPGQGTGLGLALCEGMVSRAGGAITAENLAGGGLMVTVRLPVAELDGS